MFVRKSLVEALRAEIARLNDELATYKHAFRTTTADRDRIKLMLETRDPRSADRPSSPDEVAAAGSAKPPQTQPYGPLWGRAAADYERIVGDDAIDRGAFREVLQYGGFSQFLMDADRARLEPLIDWQIGTLRDMGQPLDNLPATFHEAEAIPASLRAERSGRQVSADFLRLLAYVHTIRSRAGPDFSPRLIVEIGSGYGGLARLLKITYPDALVCLIDIPVCLRVAEFYLREALPSARVAWIDDRPNGLDWPQADFILLPADKTDGIEGLTIDLAINTWSFGEMPNAQVRKWFDFIQSRNQTDHLFLINHFMAPIRLEPDSLRHQKDHYGWITGLDRAWRINYFDIDPPIERPPFIRHKHRGIALLAMRLHSSAEIEECAEAAADAVREIHLQDWVQGSLAFNQPDESAPNEARRTLLTRPVEPLTDQTKLILDQFGRSLGLWRPDFDGSKDGAFFRLWNDIRMNGSALSVRLMRIWLHLQWHPVIRGVDGYALDTVFREELVYGLSSSGRWIRDQHLVIPDWLDERMGCF